LQNQIIFSSFAKEKNVLLFGGNFWSGFASGAISSVAASLWKGNGSTATNNFMSGGGRCFEGLATTAGITNNSASTILFGAISGGVGARVSGGNFWEGAGIGALVAGLNHSLHGEGGDCPHYPEFKTIEGNRGYWGNLESSCNMLDNMAYDIANSAYLTAKVFDFDLLGKDYSNPITGSRAFTNLDGSPEYKPGNIVLSAASLAPVSKGFSIGKTMLSNSFNSIKVPLFKSLGNVIKNYAPSLNKGKGFRFGISKANNINSN
jgi:hypothetical protein